MKPDPNGDCQKCPFKKGMMNKANGKKLPGKANGKCTRPGEFCEGRKE